MKKIEIYILEILLFISIIVFNVIYKNYYLLDLSIILIGSYSIVRFGMMKDNNYTKNSVTKIVISCILAYFITTYLLGLVLGFNKTIFSFKAGYIIEVILLEASIIIMEEIIRYIICRNTPHNKIPIILYSIILSILNIIIEINGFNLKESESLFVFLTTIVAPVLSREAICSYLTYKVSYKPSLILKLSITLYQFILPVIPNLGHYLYAVSNVALPYAIYYFSSKLIDYNKKDKAITRKIMRRISYIPFLAMLAITVLLVSGISTHTIIAIGSDSMKPTYSRGDAIIFEKKKIEDIQVGEILAFQKNGTIITHRVINIKQIGATYQMQTKGDANNAPDAFEVEESEILGVVKYSIKFIGYPTLWFNKL